MSTPAPPPGGDYDRGPEATAAVWAMVGIGLLSTVLRFTSRFMSHSTGPEDWMMLVTLICLIVFATILTIGATVGGMRHLYYLTPAETVVALRWNWISQPWVIMGFVFGKISVGLLLLRIIGPCTFWRKWILWFLMGTAFVFSFVDTVITFTQCSPVAALWNTELVRIGQAKCWDPSIQTAFAIFSACWNVLVDVVLAILPITFFWRLKFTWQKKAALCTLLGLGITAAIFAAIKTSYLACLDARSDLTWDTYDLLVWSGAELVVIIFCGSVPPTKPLFDRIVGKTRPGTPRKYACGSFRPYTNVGSNKAGHSQVHIHQEEIDLELEGSQDRARSGKGRGRDFAAPHRLDFSRRKDSCDIGGSVHADSISEGDLSGDHCARFEGEMLPVSGSRTPLS